MQHGGARLSLLLLVGVGVACKEGAGVLDRVWGLGRDLIGLLLRVGDLLEAGPE